MSILVTGASGQFGRAAAQSLLAGYAASDLILATRTPSHLADLTAAGADVRFADFNKPETLQDAFENANKVLLISTGDVGIRAGQHRNAIRAAKAAGAEHIVYTSIMGVRRADNPALVKHEHEATEIEIEKSGLAWTFLRDSQYAEAVAAAIAPIALSVGQDAHSAGAGRISFVARQDCVECAVAALTQPGHLNKAYDITGPEALTFRQAAALISEIAGKPIAYFDITDDELYARFDAMGIPRQATNDPASGPIPWCSSDMVTFEQAIRAGIFEAVTDNVQRLTGRAPRTLKEVLLAHKASWAQT